MLKMAPYILVAGISFCGFTSLKKTSFVRDQVKINSQTKTECDSRGYEKSKKQYTDKKKKNIAAYIGTWQKDDDGLYARSIINYNLKDGISKKEIEEIIENPNMSYELDVVSDSKNIHKERTSEITEEKLNEEPYAVVTIYNEDKKDYIIKKERKGTNNADTFAYFVLNSYVDLFAFLCQKSNIFSKEESKKYTKKKN